MPRLSKLGAACAAAFGFTGQTSVSTSISVNYLVVGGTGNIGADFGGGGGGGQVKTVSAVLSLLLNYSVVVGSATNSSSFNGTVAAGGVNGQDTNPVDSTNINGGASGSGNAGGNGARVYLGPYNSPYGSGGGGGQGAVGGDGSAVGYDPGVYQGGNGGVGVVWSVNGVYYGGGGGGVSQNGGHGSSSGGSNGTGYNPFGSLNGGVIVSYTSATQLYTGGTVTSTGTGASTVWFHTFTTVGTSTLSYI